MKYRGGLLTVSLWILILVCAGYYLVYSNLNLILTSQNSSFKLVDGLKISVIAIGQGKEKLKSQGPLSIQRQSRGWTLQTRNWTLEIVTSPSLRIYWKKPNGQEGESKTMVNI